MMNRKKRLTDLPCIQSTHIPKQCIELICHTCSLRHLGSSCLPKLVKINIATDSYLWFLFPFLVLHYIVALTLLVYMQWDWCQYLPHQKLTSNEQKHLVSTMHFHFYGDWRVQWTRIQTMTATTNMIGCLHHPLEIQSFTDPMWRRQRYFVHDLRHFPFCWVPNADI